MPTNVGGWGLTLNLVTVSKASSIKLLRGCLLICNLRTMIQTIKYSIPISKKVLCHICCELFAFIPPQAVKARRARDLFSGPEPRQHSMTPEITDDAAANKIDREEYTRTHTEKTVHTTRVQRKVSQRHTMVKTTIIV